MPDIKTILLVIYCLLLTAASSFSQIGNALVGSGSIIGTDTVAFLAQIGAGNLLSKQNCNTNCQVTLPVTKLKLEARRLNQQNVLLTWYTKTEVNNKGFAVQRSLGSTTSFEEISFVIGAGNSVKKISYSLKDLNPFEGTTYYRLQQVDLDGKTTYSNIADVKGQYQNKFAIFPNPARQSFNIFFSQLPIAEKYIINITDVLGKVVFSVQNTNIASTIVRMEPTGLMPGTYFISIKSVSQSYFGKLVIVR